MRDRSLHSAESDPSVAAPTSPLLSLQHATVIRGGKVVLDDLTFDIREGEHTAILGPNGCGKSSLIRLVNKQDYPLLHQDVPSPIRVFGQDRWNLLELRTQLGIVSADLQQAFITANGGGRRTGQEVALSGLFASTGIFAHQKVTRDMVKRAQQVLALVGAGQLAEKRVEEMSTGEARRILIARALAPDPRALLLDEPTTGLDLVARDQFLKMLQGIAERGKTVLLVTHHIEEILPQIRRVILLKAGHVFADGPKQDVLSSRQISALYGTSVKLEPNGDYYTSHCERG